MAVFESFTKKVAETAKAAAKKSSELVEVTKLNMNIGAEETKIEKTYSEIGKIVYQKYAEGEDVGDMFREQCEKIKSYEEVIKDLKQKILDLKNVKLCTGCGTELAADVVFCSKCGSKQEIVVAQSEAAPAAKFCPSCGSSVDNNSAFCAKCGSKV